jgi:hypothetical protein
MSRNPLNIPLVAEFSGKTWDGLTWSVSDVAPDDTEYAATLASARFQLQNSAGVAVLTLSTANADEMTINESAANAWSVTVEPHILTVASGVYSYGLETTDADGRIKIKIAGTLEINHNPVL